MKFIILKSRAKKWAGYMCDEYVELALFEYFLVVVAVVACLIGPAAVLWLFL